MTFPRNRKMLYVWSTTSIQNNFFLIEIKMTTIEFFYSMSKSDTSLGSDIPSNWKQYLSNFTNYDTSSDYPSVEAKYQAMKFCFSDKPEKRFEIDWKNSTGQQTKSYGSKTYFKTHNIQLDSQKWNHHLLYIMEILVQHRFENDELFRKILQRVQEKNIQLVHYSMRDTFWGARMCKKTNHLIGENHLGSIYAKFKFQSSKKRKDDVSKDNDVKKDIDILEYKIGQPISVNEAKTHFINNTIDLDKIPSEQKKNGMITQQGILDVLTLDYIPLKDCVQLKQDGYILPKTSFHTLIEENTRRWQGKENVGFKSLNTKEDVYYGNLVLYGFDDNYKPQKDGILLIQRELNSYKVKYKKKESIPSHFFKITYCDKNKNPYRYLNGSSVIFYVPDNEDGRKILLLYLDCFKKGNMFGFSFQSVRFGRIHLKTSLYGTYGFPDESFELRASSELAKNGVTPYTISFNHNKGLWSMEDPYPLEKRWLIQWNL